MKNTRHLLILLLLACCLFPAFPAIAGYTVVPMQLKLDAKQGAVVTRTLQAENLGEEPVSIKISVNDFIKGPEGEERQVPPDTVERGCANRFNLSPQRLDLGPHEVRDINLTMTMPDNADGTYWGNILVSQVSKPTLSKTLKQGNASFQIFALQDMLIRVIETVPGTEHRSGALTDMFFQKPAPGSIPTVQVVFKNTGNTLLKCEGTIEIRDDTGRTVESIPLDYGNSPFTVYPEGTRNVYARIQKTLPAGDYIILAIIDYGGENLVAGQIEYQVP